MENNNIEQRVVAIIAKSLHKKEADIKPNLNLATDLGVDSLDFFELLMAFEDEFHVTVSDEEASKFATVADVVNYLKNIK